MLVAALFSNAAYLNCFRGARYTTSHSTHVATYVKTFFITFATDEYEELNPTNL